MSYPAIEAYEISNFVDRTFELRARLGSEMKDYINKNAKVISMNKISRDSIIHAGAEMQAYLDEYGIALDLDDFSSTNGAVFINEEQSLKESCTYRVLSMLSYRDVQFDKYCLSNLYFTYKSYTGGEG